MKTKVGQVENIYDKMVRTSEDFERDRIIGTPNPTQPILDLAQRVITAVDELLPNTNERKNRWLLYFKDHAETMQFRYSPFPPVQYDPETLKGAREAVLHSMGMGVARREWE